MSPSIESTQLYRDCRSEQVEVQRNAYCTLWAYLYPIGYHIVRDQPQADALAQDCTQMALVRIHQRLHECQSPAAFRSWARRIVSNIAIDELRRRKRLVDLNESEQSTPNIHILSTAVETPEQTVLAQMDSAQLRELLNQAPVSERSRRVIVGRFLDDTPDELLAQTESQLADKTVLPSHIQVTRAKNIAKLRKWKALATYLQPNS